MGIMDKIMSLLEDGEFRQKDLYDYLGVKAQTFSDWKAGRNKSYIKHITQIAKFFDVSVEYLTGESDTSVIFQSGKTPTPIQNKNKKMLNLPETEHITENEYKLVQAYRSKPEMHDAIHKLLEIDISSDKDASENIIYRAARSYNRIPAEITTVSDDFIKKLEDASETDEEF